MNSNLQGADLRGAKLSHTWITNSKFDGANLDSVISNGLIGDPKSLPDGWKIEDGIFIRSP